MLRSRRPLYLLFFALLLVLPGCSQHEGKRPLQLQKIVISTYYGDQSALLFVADRLGYFREEGLQVELRKTASGVSAIDAVVDGNSDLATAAEFVFVGKSFSHPQLRVLSTLSRSRSVKLILRRDRGTASFGDLQGKTIAITKGTIAEYFFEQFIDEAGLKTGQVRVVDTAPNDLQALFAQGTVDGVAVWNPVADRIATQMADKVEVRSLQGEEPYHFILVGTEQLVKGRGEHVVRLLRALVRAESYLSTNRSSGAEIVASATGIPIDVMPRLAKDTTPEVSLTRSLMISMETQANWLLSSTGSKQPIPNYLEKIALEPLLKANRDAVTIVH